MTSLNTQIKNYFGSSDGPLTDIQLDILKEYGGWVAGGALSSLICNRPIRDIDVYVPSFEAALAFADDSIIISGSRKALVCAPKEPDMPPVQLVFDRYYDSPEDIFKAFDFTVCMAAYDFKNDDVIVRDGFIEDNLSRELKFNRGTLYPIMSNLRIEKYREYGYTISTLEQLKILTAISQLNINDLKDLKRQIGGMYGSLMELQNVQTLDGFFEAEPSALSYQPDTVDAQGAIDLLLESRYPDLDSIFIKTVRRISDGVYQSHITTTDRRLEYKIGTVLDTKEIRDPLKKLIYLSSVSDDDVGWSDGDVFVVQFQRIEKYPLPACDGTWVYSKAHAGKFEIKRVLGTAMEWRKLTLEERVKMVTEEDF
jgi:hypothetical protein